MSIPIPTALLRAMQKVYGDNWDRHEVFADIMQCMEATFDRTADDEKTIRAAIDCFIELWMGQVEWEHLEDEDYDDEAAEIEARGKLRAAWRAELSADIVAQPNGTELTPDQRAVLGGDQIVDASSIERPRAYISRSLNRPFTDTTHDRHPIIGTQA